jgi:uncharacterized protein (DUF1778 family)
MTVSEQTSMTLRMPASLRKRIKRAAAAEQRTESQFVRFHLSRLLEATAKPRKTA